MTRRKGRLIAVAVAVLLLLIVAAHAVMMLYTDALWFNAVGYASVFWRRVVAGIGARVLGTIIGGGIVLANLWLIVRRLGTIHLRRRYGNLEIAEQVPRSFLIGLVIVASILAGWWLASMEFGEDAGIALLAWTKRVHWGVTDPLFGHDISFYVFSFPIYERVLDFLFVSLLWSTILAGIGYALLGMIRWQERRLHMTHAARVHLVTLAAGVIALLAARFWLDRYGIAMAGASAWVGYSDVRARLPALAGLTALSLAAAGTLAYSGWKARWLPALVALVALVLGAVVLEEVYPGVVQKFKVEPNQLASETPYIKWNLDFTRMAYGLDGMRREPFPYGRGNLPSWSAMEPLVASVPVWDREPLRTNFNQTEVAYNYYRFPDVDLDRYGPPDDEAQVAIGIREFDPSGLPAATRTWQTLHLNPKYIQGWGAVVVPAAQTSPGGEPAYWLHNLNPIKRSAAAPAEVSLTDPGVFFGETTQDYAVLVPGRDSAFTGTPGVDFPAGVRLSSLVRLAAFAWRFGEKNLLFSGELTDSSRIVFRRSVQTRLQALARWIIWDSDPYPVLLGGRVVWVVDGYTVSGTFPFARAMDLPDVGRIRYIRNSVKATVDAVTGAVRLYAADATDPVLRTFERVFPDFVLPLDSMPPRLRDHLRYPVMYLQLQAQILEEYHLLRADNFFAGQDVWAVADEGGSEGVPRPYVPTYAMSPLPGDSHPEFLLTVPFVARERHNMTAVLAARSDPPHYGQLVLLELPRDQLVPGPTQVHALIEQDPIISQQLSLWRQGGSDVLVGHLRIVPVDSSFMYVVPLFLVSKENSVPELGRVVVSDGHDVSMATGLQAAVVALNQGTTQTPASTAVTAPPTGSWPARALELMQQAETHLKNGDWAGFGTVWKQLGDYLRSLEAKPAAAGHGPPG